MHPTLRHTLRVAISAVALVVAIASTARSYCNESGLLGTPTPYLSGPNTSYLVMDDFNRDGLLDLAVTNVDRGPGSVNSSLSVLLATSPLTFAPAVHYLSGGGVCGIVARDFNGDGITDLAVARLFMSKVSVLLGQGSGGIGNGSFAAEVDYPTGTGPFELVSADFNGDGIMDLATPLNTTPSVCVLPGLGSGGVGNGTFGGFTTFPIGNLGTGIATADFNHDAIPDLVATEYNSGTVGVLLGTGSPAIGAGSFSPVSHFAAGIQPYHIEIADFNEDGSPDLAVANTGGGGVAVLLGSGNGSFVLQTTLNSGNTSAAAAGDLNHDGILDIVTGTVTGVNVGVAKVFLGKGSGGVGDGTFGPATTYASSGDVFEVYLRDLDQDGALDAVVTQGWGSYVDVLPGTCAAPPLDPRAPLLTDVRDVPNDNGGKVFLTWIASSLDVSGGAVNSYRVWRRIPPAMMSRVTPARLASRDVIAAPMNGLAVYWEALATLPAQRLAGYGYTAATTQDSLPGSNPYTAFFVSALTSNIDVFYSSAIDSGYSVDNISPQPPGPMAGVLQGSSMWLHWGPAPDADLAGYRLYRGASADFVPLPGTQVAAPADTGWLDLQGHGEWFYKVSAVDIHSNESDFSSLAPLIATAVDATTFGFALSGVRPNPSMNGRLSVSFSLAGGPGARLELLDVAGRLVVARDVSGLGPGSHVLTVGDEKPLPSGVYFVRLIEDRQVLGARAVVTR
jgi:hypothetical protein